MLKQIHHEGNIEIKQVQLKWISCQAGNDNLRVGNKRRKKEKNKDKEEEKEK